jgi:hypothetical protein
MVIRQAKVDDRRGVACLRMEGWVDEIGLKL